MAKIVFESHNGVKGFALYLDGAPVEWAKSFDLLLESVVYLKLARVNVSGILPVKRGDNFDI